MRKPFAFALSISLSTLNVSALPKSCDKVPQAPESISAGGRKLPAIGMEDPKIFLQIMIF
jgi:hypothetical protein